MVIATLRLGWVAQDGRERQTPLPWDEAEERPAVPAHYLPPAARQFHITDPEQWIDLCA
jgi:hypothetical protein